MSAPASRAAAASSSPYTRPPFAPILRSSITSPSYRLTFRKFIRFVFNFHCFFSPVRFLHRSLASLTPSLFRLPSPLLTTTTTTTTNTRFLRAAATAGGGKRISQSDFTEKAWQAIVAAPEEAKERNQQMVETEHLLKTLLEQPNGLARRIVSKAGGNPTSIVQATESFIIKQPRVAGSNLDQILGRNLEAVVNNAMEHRDRMGDKYTSVEHLLLAVAKDPRFGRAVFSDAGITFSVLEAAVLEVRGNTQVTDQSPEEKVRTPPTHTVGTQPLNPISVLCPHTFDNSHDMCF